MKKAMVLLIMASVFLMGAGASLAWEPDEDFDYEAPYSINANCGGGCEIRFGQEFLDGGSNK